MVRALFYMYVGKIVISLYEQIRHNQTFRILYLLYYIHLFFPQGLC